jgi:FkbM family methyltransferase
MTTIVDLAPYFGLRPTCLVHVGANDGAEAELYSASGISKALYIEAVPDIFELLEHRLSNYPGHSAYCAVCAEADGNTVEFFVADNKGQSSSMFEFGTHATSHPNVRFQGSLTVTTRALDSILAEQQLKTRWDALVVDVQGAEMQVLRGARSLLNQVCCAMIEVSDGEVYRGGAQLDEILSFMSYYDFELRYLFINHHNWGDGFFVKR